MLLACHRCYQLPTFNDNCLECQDCNWHQWAEDENDAVSDALEAKQLIPIEASDRGVNYLYQSDTWKGYKDENGKLLGFYRTCLAKVLICFVKTSYPVRI